MKAFNCSLCPAAVLLAVFGPCRRWLAGQQTAKPGIAQSPRARGRPRVTWCGPCRKECPPCPHGTKRKGSVDMVGIALDTTDNIGEFLKQTPVSYPIYVIPTPTAATQAHGNNAAYCPSVVEAPKCGYKQPSPAKSTKSLTAAVNLAKTKIKQRIGCLTHVDAEAVWKPKLFRRLYFQTILLVLQRQCSGAEPLHYQKQPKYL